jgi:cytochrome P450
VLVGGFTTPPIPDVGVLIRPTDQAALTRTLAALRARFGRAFKPSGDGFEFRTPQGFALTVRRARDRLVIASSPAYAQRLLRASPDKLADDAVYRRALGGSSDRVGFQLFVRLDRVRALVEGFMDGPALRRYRRETQPLLSAFESLAMRATARQGASDFRLVLSVSQQ